MNTALLSVAFANNALYLPGDAVSSELSPAAAALLVVLNKHGLCVDEDTLHHLNALGDDDISAIDALIREVYRTDANWAALTREWNTRPTGVSFINFFVTALANVDPEFRGHGTTLPCGHFIPDGVFDLSRYTGCPFCGTSFVSAKANLEIHDAATLTELHRWTQEDADKEAAKLLAMPTPLDATMSARLRKLVEGLPADLFVNFDEIPCAETRALVGAEFLERGDMRFADFAKTPTDMLRLLWSIKTGRLRITRPADEKKFLEKYHNYYSSGLITLADNAAEMKLKLHYNRTTGRAVARRFESFDMSAEEICVNMHPYRQMWVRFIRALRLNDQARRCGLEKLSEVLDRFYRRDYCVWSGEVDKARMSGNLDRLLTLLRQRPGAFARCLFDTVLDFGMEPVSKAFAQVATKLPVRLLVSLYNAVSGYFLPTMPERHVVLPSGLVKALPYNPGISRLSESERRDIALELQQVVLTALYDIYSVQEPLSGDKVYIDRELYECPVPVGDRGNSVAVSGSAIPGQKFDVKGDKVRVFMHWGVGMPAMHFDMDLSCLLVGKDKKVDIAYYNLDGYGAIHSGDIQRIPDTVGAAEYIELDIPELLSNGLDYAVFTTNAYSVPKLSPDVIVGWMSSEHPMKVDNETGVAYNPADVDHMVTVGAMSLSRGMVFGILDLHARKILWLEAANNNRTLAGLDLASIEALQKRLAEKISIGALIALKAKARGVTVSTVPTDAKVYDMSNWHEAGIL